jgi:hypothetical protein
MKRTGRVEEEELRASRCCSGVGTEENTNTVLRASDSYVFKSALKSVDKGSQTTMRMSAPASEDGPSEMEMGTENSCR